MRAILPPAPEAPLPPLVHEAGPALLPEALDGDPWEEDRPAPRDELVAAIRDADALMCQSHCRVDAALLDAAPRLRVVSNVAVGYDNVDVAAATSRRIAVCNTPVSALHEATA